jgi:Na+/melibiose symporter-like transporter
MTTTEAKQRKRWVVPAVAVAIGVVYLVAGFRGGDEAFGWGGLGLMTAVAVVAWLISLKSETVEGLLVRSDERINSIDRDATVFSGMVVLLTVLGGFVIEIAQGQDGQPYATLGAIGGVAYVGALVWLRFRR